MLLFFSSCRNQFTTIKNHNGFFVSSKEFAVKMYQPRDQYYGLKAHDTILSIGAESGANEVVYGLLTDSLHFILENISLKYLNQPSVDFSNSYYEKMFAKKNTSTYTIQIGNDSSTLLPASSCRKIIVENSLHEFSDAHRMMKELYRILKPGSDLYIFERLATPKHTVHQSCGKHLYFQDELVALMQKEQFRFVGTSVFVGVNLFTFRKD